MLLTESELREIIRNAILQEAWYHDLFGIEDDERILAKKTLSQLKGYMSDGLSTKDALKRIRKDRETIRKKNYKPSFWEQIEDIEEESEEIEDMLYNSMSRAEKKDFLKQKVRAKQKSIDDGSYWKEMSMKFN